MLSREELEFEPEKKKGNRVLVKTAAGENEEGTIFWVGRCKYTNQPRIGAKTDEGETVWCYSNEAMVLCDDGVPAGAIAHDEWQMYGDRY